MIHLVIQPEVNNIVMQGPRLIHIDMDSNITKAAHGLWFGAHLYWYTCSIYKLSNVDAR